MRQAVQEQVYLLFCAGYCELKGRARGGGYSVALAARVQCRNELLQGVIPSVGEPVPSKPLELTCTIIFCFGKRKYFFGSDKSKDHSKTESFFSFVLPKRKIIVQLSSRVCA